MHHDDQRQVIFIQAQSVKQARYRNMLLQVYFYHSSRRRELHSNCLKPTQNSGKSGCRNHHIHYCNRLHMDSLTCIRLIFHPKNWYILKNGTGNQFYHWTYFQCIVSRLVCIHWHSLYHYCIQLNNQKVYSDIVWYTHLSVQELWKSEFVCLSTLLQRNIR